jgi:hypothetical protein
MLQRRGDARSDIYSLGIMLFECLYGEVPFRGDSEWEVLKKHEVALPEFPPHALAGDRAAILRCLAKKPEERFLSVTELLHALHAPAALGESLVIGAAPAPRPALAAAVPPPLPVAGESPRGMPWRDEPPRGPMALFVRGMFSAFEVAILVMMLPVRVISVVAGRGVLWAFALPFRILGLTAKLVGLLLAFGVIALLVAGVFYLITAA